MRAHFRKEGKRMGKQQKKERIKRAEGLDRITKEQYGDCHFPLPNNFFFSSQNS